MYAMYRSASKVKGIVGSSLSVLPKGHFILLVIFPKTQSFSINQLLLIQPSCKLLEGFRGQWCRSISIPSPTNTFPTSFKANAMRSSLHTPRFKCLVICSFNHPIDLYGFKQISFNNVHQVRLHPLWPSLMHLWPTIRLIGDTLSMCSIKGVHYTHIKMFLLIFLKMNVGFHLSYEQTCVLPMPSLQSSHWCVDIMLTSNGVHTLAHVIITDLTCIDLVS